MRRRKGIPWSISLWIFSAFFFCTILPGTVQAQTPDLHLLKRFQAHEQIEGYRSPGNLTLESLQSGNRLITSGAEGYVKIWALDRPDSPLVVDVNGPDQPNIIQDGNRQAQSLAVNEDKEYFLAGVGLNPSKIQVRNLRDDSLRSKYKSPGDVDDLDFLPNSNQVIQPYTEGYFLTPVSFFMPFLRGVYGGYIEFHAPSTNITQKGVYHWQDAREVAVSANGKCIATGAQDGGLGLWNAETGDRKWVRYHESTQPLVSDVAIGIENEKVFSVGNDHRIKAWSVDMGWDFWSSSWPLWEKRARLNEIEVDPKGRFVAGTNSYKDDRHFVAFFDPDSGEILREIDDLHETSIEVIEITENGSQMITGARDGTVKIWKVSSI